MRKELDLQNKLVPDREKREKKKAEVKGLLGLGEQRCTILKSPVSSLCCPPLLCCPHIILGADQRFHVAVLGIIQLSLGSCH